jgi:hypothetical protein
MAKGADSKKQKKPDVVTRECTIHLHKRVHNMCASGFVFRFCLSDLFAGRL